MLNTGFITEGVLYLSSFFLGYYLCCISNSNKVQFISLIMVIIYKKRNSFEYRLRACECVGVGVDAREGVSRGGSSGDGAQGKGVFYPRKSQM